MRLVSGIADRLVSSMLRLSSLQVVVLFVVMAVLFSLLIVLAIDLAWDGQFNYELQFAGFLTPLIDGLIIVSLLTLLLSSLRKEAVKRAEAERTLNEAQRIAHIGNWHLDLKQGGLSWSDEIYRIFEIEPAHFNASYEAFLGVVHPDDREAVDLSFRYSLEHHQPYAITHRLLMADGRIKYIHERGESYYAKDGTPEYTIGTVQDITERVLLEQELSRLATTDTLTGIPNRRSFNQWLEREVATANRYAAAFSLVMFDIDNFKQVNDEEGHDSGDRLLCHVAELAQDSMRKSDVLVRWGGDEFMLLLPHTPLQDAEQLAERLRVQVEKERFMGRAVTLSLGLTEYRVGESPRQLLKRTDRALYEAKHSGRNTVVACQK